MHVSMVVVRTSTPPTLNLPLFLRAYTRALTMKVSHALMSFRLLVLNDPIRTHPSAPLRPSVSPSSEGPHHPRHCGCMIVSTSECAI